MAKIALYPSLEDKVVLITGGASGIGESMVKKFLQQGSKVAFIDKEKKLGLNLVKKLQNYNHKPIFVECDLINIPKLKKSISEIRKKIGRISILINNAANDTRHNFEKVTPEYWDNRLNVNLRHFFFTIQSTYKDMKFLGKGSIVNLGSFSWMKGTPGMPGYTTSKSAIAGLTKTFARELGPYNIRVNCVAPGLITTERQKKLWITPTIKKETFKRQCIKRFLVPEDISKVVLFFASDESSGCTAQNYIVDGGTVT